MLAAITEPAQANLYLDQIYRPLCNAECAAPAAEAGGAYVPYIGPAVADILSEQYERTMALNNRSGQVFFGPIIAENLILGLIGTALGVVVEVALAVLISAIGIPMPPPPSANVGYTA